MRRPILLTLSLTLATAGPLTAGTFDRARIAPDLGLDVLDRQVTREQVGRDLFSDPWATVTIGHVDVYDVFPYLESRSFDIVSDPKWNRLVYGEPGRTLRAFDGGGTSVGALRSPRGLAVDEFDHVYVADAGNNRVVVLDASTEFGELTLVPRATIDGLSDPYAVAYSDGGTPFQTGDDRLLVADTGRNRVVAYALEAAGPRRLAEIGGLGSGVGRFAGPLAITVGRANGANTPDVYVADSHTRRLVHLRLEGGTLAWSGAIATDADVVTALDVDQWGNLYAAAPRQGRVRKFAPSLEPVATLVDGLTSPKQFHVPYVNVRDHRTNQVTRSGQPNGVSLERWTDDSGLRQWALGVDVTELAVTAGVSPAARFVLTDQADVTLEIADATSGRTLSRHPLGVMAAGSHDVAFSEADRTAAAGEGRTLRLVAASSYANGSTVRRELPLSTAAGVLPARPVLLGNTPNPARAATRIAFLLPANAGDRVSLRIHDPLGRTVRTYSRGFTPGRNEVLWDGLDATGAPVAPGVYFYRLDVNREELTQKLVLVR